MITANLCWLSNDVAQKIYEITVNLGVRLMSLTPEQSKKNSDR